MKLVIHYQSRDTGSEIFTVVLKYSLLWTEARREITSQLPAAANHYGPINAFSYMNYDDAPIFVDDNVSYLVLQAFSRRQNNEVEVQLNRLDALQLARRWGTTKHENVFDILKRNKLDDTVLVDTDPEGGVSVYYHLRGKKDTAKKQLNKLEDPKGWLDSETIDWFMMWWCRENKETMLHSSRDWTKDRPFKNTATQKTIVMSSYATTKIVDRKDQTSFNQFKGLNLAVIQQVILPLHVDGNHYTLIVIEVTDKEYYLTGNTPAAQERERPRRKRARARQRERKRERKRPPGSLFY
jgi:hypothetical protein